MEVVTEQLHDQRGVLVGVLVEVSSSAMALPKAVLAMAGLLRGVLDLAVEDERRARPNLTGQAACAPC